MRKERFQTQFREPERHHSEPGKRMHKVYGPVFDDNGRLHLEEKGEESIYDYIQSFAESVDIHVIMKRFTNGETDVLSKVQGFYGDFTGLPVNYAQMLNTVQDGERLFESLPVEQRAKFGHSFNEFMTSLCDGSLMERLGIVEDKPDPSPSEPPPSPSEE